MNTAVKDTNKTFVTKGHLLHHSLTFKAVLLVGGILLLALLEIWLALYFKAELKRDFLTVSEFDKAERSYLLGIMMTSKLASELSIPARGMVFFRVSTWQKSLEDLEVLERHLAIQSAQGQENQITFQELYKEMQQLLDNDADKEQLIQFATRVKKHVGRFNLRLEKAVKDTRKERARVVAQYGQQSDVKAMILLVVGLSGLVVMLLVVGLFLSRLLGSLRQLQGRAKMIAAGNFGSLIPTNRKDEVGLLVHSVNTMATALEERENEISDFRRRLFQQEKMFTIGSFAAGLAHEVGNPIQALVALNSQAIGNLSDSPDENAIRETLDNLILISEQIERLSNIVREIRSYAHTDSDNMKLTNINEVISETLNLMRFDSRFKGVQVVVDLSLDCPAIVGVGDHISQVLINLFINAADAVEGIMGKIMISTNYENPFLRIVISDNGGGMIPEALDRAFEPFFTTKEKEKGTGLGLAVCKQIIDDHEGQINIHSTVGQGTTITVRLPANQKGIRARDMT